MKKLLLINLALISNSVIATDVAVTQKEENAMMAGLKGAMERLMDPKWIALSLEKGEGCWLDKDTLVQEGSETMFEDVPSRCVSWDLGVANKNVFAFMPTRVANACDDAKRPYNKCIDEK